MFVAAKFILAFLQISPLIVERLHLSNALSFGRDKKTGNKTFKDYSGYEPFDGPHNSASFNLIRVSLSRYSP